MSGLRADPGWLLDDTTLQCISPTHAARGARPPTTIGDATVAVANVDLKRPVEYYEDRIRALGLVGHERVLDVGCGVGSWSVALARHCGEVHGVDATSEHLAFAESLIRAQNLENAHLTHGSIDESLPFPDEYFSAVVCHGLPALAKPRRALLELARVVRGGGVVYVTARGVGWPLHLVLESGLTQTALTTIAESLRRGRLCLRRRQIERAVRAAGLRIEALGAEGSVRLAPVDFEALYPSSRFGLPVVLEVLATRIPPARSQVSTPAATELPSAGELRARGQDFERRVAGRPRGLTVVPVPGPSVPVQYGRRHAEDVRARLRGVDEDAWLDTLASRTVEGAKSDQDAVQRIICLLQDSFFHDPVEQPPVELSSLELLLLGDGRCGHVATVAVDLLDRIGLPARVRQLPRHIVAEVFLDGDWRIVDPDAFKNGVIPVGPSGQLLSFRDLERNPYQIDRFAPTGFWVRPRTRYTQNPQGTEITGYVDSIPPEERGYPSSWYAWWVPPEYPPSLPELHPAEVRGRSVRLAWSASRDRDGDLSTYRVRVGTTSRGWSYDHAVYERLLLPTPDDVASFETRETEAEIAVARTGDFYWSVQAVDAHTEKEPGTFYWSSDEGSFTVE